MIVTLCGSTRFKGAFIDWYERFTDMGHIVLTVGRFLPKQDHDSELKKKLDQLHLKKIELSSMVFILDVGGYIGESTRNEIAYAEKLGKHMHYLSRDTPDYEEPLLEETDIGRAILGDTVEVMKKIACLDDEGANRKLEETGSYGRFDEPGSVQIARKWLKERNLI